MKNKNLALVATLLAISVMPAFAMNPQDEKDTGYPRVMRKKEKNEAPRLTSPRGTPSPPQVPSLTKKIVPSLGRGAQPIPESKDESPKTSPRRALPLPINHYPEPPIVNRGGKLSLGLDPRKAPTASSSSLSSHESPQESPKEPTASNSLPPSESPQPAKKRRSSKTLSHPRDIQGSPRSRKGSISSPSPHQGSPRSRKNSTSSLSPCSDDEQKNDFPLTSRGRKPSISLPHDQQSSSRSQNTLDSPGPHRERKVSISPGDAKSYRDPSSLRRSRSPSNSPEKTHKKRVDAERDSGPQRVRLRSQSDSLRGKTSDTPSPQDSRNPSDALLRDLEAWNFTKTKPPTTPGKIEQENELKVRMTYQDHQELQRQYKLQRPRDLNNPNTELPSTPNPVKKDEAHDANRKGN